MMKRRKRAREMRKMCVCVCEGVVSFILMQIPLRPTDIREREREKNGSVCLLKITFARVMRTEALGPGG
jgi:hypothetical protein